MIFRLLTNANYLIYFFCIFVILILLTYLIYKLFIIENDLFIVNEKINKIELEINHDNKNNYNYNDNENIKDINLSEIIMNEVFNSNDNTCFDINKCKINDDAHSIDIDTIINDETIIKTTEDNNNEKVEEKKVLFDLKKEIIMDDKESIISENTLTKKKLQKLNLDKLKDKCNEYQLSTEGTKAQLVDRIFDEINKEN